MLTQFTVFLLEDKNLSDPILFVCQAEDIPHAVEQASNAYPESLILSVTSSHPMARIRMVITVSDQRLSLMASHPVEAAIVDYDSNPYSDELTNVPPPGCPDVSNLARVDGVITTPSPCNVLDHYFRFVN